MKDMMKDRLILLATAQEFMSEIDDKMNKWDQSQLFMEKSAFESLNLSDEVLKLSKEGNALVGRLLECCQGVVRNPGAMEQKKVMVVLEEIHEVFQKINDATTSMNEIAHNIEEEAAKQRVIEDGVKTTLIEVGSSIDTVAACAELMIADL